ncbi:hypothetical protein [Streptomyces narbonensis]|uniref:hypothetical protein n=1 Tax=Streptomyces narbonensis TaxID=67333 RepID=UPI001679C5FF|nr:hypothetical protein [Streptomyces narbonensis]GGV97922.1 hypothetical protein GCM10010230_20030 [Streptomyces narbonensis]
MPKHHRPRTAALILICLAVTGCTTSADPKPSATPPPTTTTPSPQGESEEAQGKRAKAALGQRSLGELEPDFVESGLERVQDGVHNLSPVKKGKAYKLSVACVGKGTVKVAVADGDPEPVPCDGVRATRNVENAPAHLPIDVEATPGATGMVAWQLTSIPS